MAARRRVWRFVLPPVAATASCAAFAAFHYRPDPTDELIANQGPLSRRFKSSTNLSDQATEPEPLLLRLGRGLVLGSVGIASRVFLYALNSTEVEKNERHSRLVELVRHRPHGQPLLTVANHTSTLDDPALPATLAPWDVLLFKPSKMRWSICSQEICFENAALATFFGAGKVLPIKRGGGVDQKLLLDFARRLAAGDWCHIFPEGATVQTGSLGGRADPLAVARSGRLKWGVGKLIAHAPTLPMVVPIHHTGMQDVVAEHPRTKDVLPSQPTTGNAVTIRVGPEVSVFDLIEDHERRHGRLRKYGTSPALDDAAWEPMWQSTLEERALYGAITRRVEAALEALEREAKEKLGDHYPTIPKVVSSGRWRALVGEEEGEEEEGVVSAAEGEVGGGDGGSHGEQHKHKHRRPK